MWSFLIRCGAYICSRPRPRVTGEPTHDAVMVKSVMSTSMRAHVDLLRREKKNTTTHAASIPHRKSMGQGSTMSNKIKK